MEDDDAATAVAAGLPPNGRLATPPDVGALQAARDATLAHAADAEREAVAA
jgi:hypothetical protein